MKNAPTTQHLFAYGTLRSDQPEHRLYGPVSLSREMGQVAGELYQLEEGYPILRVSQESVLRVASQDWLVDWTSAIAHLDALENGFSGTRVPLVKGELIEIPLERDALRKADQWEGYTIGGSSVYQRVIIPAIRSNGSIVPTWAYTCSEIPASATRIPAGYWKRPPRLGS